MIREAVRVRQAGIKPGYDLVWIARTALTDQTDFWEVDRTVETLLRRARLLDFVPAQATNRPRKSEVRNQKSETPASSGVSNEKLSVSAAKEKTNTKKLTANSQ